MRCERAQEWMTARMDGELSAWRSSRLDRHLASCATCGAEADSTSRLFEALAMLPASAPVGDRLTQDTMRAVRAVADEERACRTQQAWWQRLQLLVPMVSAAAVLALAVRTVEGPIAPPTKPEAQVANSGQAGRASARDARRRPSGTTAVASVRRSPLPQNQPPAELAAAPDLFVELPILLQLEKLQHFESIRTTTVDEQVPDHEDQTNG